MRKSVIARLVISAFVATCTVVVMAQTRTVLPADTLILTPKTRVDTVRIHDTTVVTKCYNASMQPITCPTTPVPPDTTTPPPCVEGCQSNEPSGLTKVLERAFNSINENGWTDDGGKWSSSHECGNWMSGCNWPDLKELMTITQDATATHTPPNVGSQWFPKGYQAGGAPAISSHTFATSKTLYVQFRVKYSSNWYGESDSEVNKNIYVAGPGANGQLCTYLTAQGRGTGNLILEVHLQCSPTVNRVPNLAPCIVTRGVWHNVELVMLGNTTGASNGTIDWWMDNVKCGHYTNQRWMSGATTFNLFQWAPVYGGVATKVPADQYQYMDHVYVSGKP